MEGKLKPEYSCISFFKAGKCPRAHTSNCPFVIKGVDYSKECSYSDKKVVKLDHETIQM